MGRIIYALHVSLDGFVEGPSGQLDWAVVDEHLYRRFNDEERDIAAHLYGRRTFETMASTMPALSEDRTAPDYMVRAARIWLEKPKVVFSRTLDRVNWNARLVKDNAVVEMARLKRQFVKDMFLAGPNLAASILPLGLIDEYRLYVNPVLLGTGKPMFPRKGKVIQLRLVESTALSSGIVVLRYSPANGSHSAPGS